MNTKRGGCDANEAEERNSAANEDDERQEEVRGQNEAEDEEEDYHYRWTIASEDTST